MRTPLSALWRLTALLVVVGTLHGCYSTRHLPENLSMNSPPAAASDVRFLADRTWVDRDGKRHVEQEIFDAQLALIAGARRLIVLDVFLYNDFQGPEPETTRALTAELTGALLARKQAVSEIEIVVITDPVNSLYGALPAPWLIRLQEAGIQVVETNLDPLPDSNPFYSVFWRLFIRPFGNSPGDLLPNPIGPDRVSLRTYLELLNFKANHRKTLLADTPDGFRAVVSSANPHDGSSAHSNAGVMFDGRAVRHLLDSENAVLQMSRQPTVRPMEVADVGPSDLTVRVITEDEIQTAVLETLDASTPEDRVDLMMFYLSDREIVEALLAAHGKGTPLRILLDPNKDAFGREKNGIPNRQVARELHRAGISVRWCDTHGEQCHTKMLLRRAANGSGTLVIGSANYTRRNVDFYNLETDVVVAGPVQADVFQSAGRYFEDFWGNTPDRHYSTDYATYEDNSIWRQMLYRFMEATGFSTF